MSALRRPRCECCDEVLNELAGIRQNFEKFYHRLNSQFVKLQLEFRALVSKPESEESFVTVANNANNSTAGFKRKAPTIRSDSRWSRAGSNDSALPNHIARSSNRNRKQNNSKQSKFNSGKTPTSIKTESIPKIKSFANTSKFVGVQLRVMAPCPFKSDVDYEQWESLLPADEPEQGHLKTRRNKEPMSASPTASSVDTVPPAVQSCDKETTVTDKTTVSEVHSATPDHISQLDKSLTASTVFDSPKSLKEFEQVLPMLESKDKVIIEAKQLKRKMSLAQMKVTNAPQHRSSIEKMFEELEHRRRELDHIAASANSTKGLNIKQESEDFDETREDDYHDDFDFDEDLDSKPEETHNQACIRPSTKEALKMSETSNAGFAHNSNWEIIPKKEVEDVDIKPAVSELALVSQKENDSVHPFPFTAHTSDIEKLHEQQRQFKKRDESKRPRDDLDDMFARMNSDTEEDEDDIF